LALIVIHRQHDHTLRAGEDLLRVRAPVLVPLQPRHVASAAIGEPLPEIGGMRGRDACGDAAEIEAEFLGKRDERGFHDSDCHENARRASAINALAVASWESTVVSRVHCATAS